jgi:hypothetical protein
VAAGFQACRPGRISRDAKSGCSAKAKRDTLTAMPLEVSNFTKSRREVRTVLPIGATVLAPARCCWIYFAETTTDGIVGLDHKHVTPRILQICKVETVNTTSAAEFRLNMSCVTLALNYDLRRLGLFPDLSR